MVIDPQHCFTGTMDYSTVHKSASKAFQLTTKGLLEIPV